jgi:hypothetical protein
MANSQGSDRKPAPAPVKVHHFEKRAPRSLEPQGRGREFSGGDHPTIPELALIPPRMGGAAGLLQAPPQPVKREPPPPEPKAEPAPPPRAEPEAPSRGGKGKGSRKSRASRGGSFSRSKAPPDAPSPPNAVGERLSQAERLFAEGKLEEARVILERLVILGVATAPVHTQLGAIYLEQGAIKRALERFEEALTLDPEELSARLYRAEARMEFGDLLLAQQDLQRVLDEGTGGSPLVQRAQHLLQALDEERGRKRR